MLAGLGAPFALLYLGVGGWRIARSGAVGELVWLAPFALCLALSAYARRVRSGPVTPFRAGWPLLLWPLLYGGAAHIVMLAPDLYVDGPLAAADAWLLSQPVGPPEWPLGGPVEEIANLVYASYYFVVPGAFVWAWRRRGAEAAATYAAALFFAFVPCALVWLVLPSGGYHAGGSPVGPAFGPFTALVRFLYAMHPHFAAAFPSSHVALTTTAALLIVVMGGSRAWLVWPVLMAVATVYGQYHYVVDSPPAIAIGGAAAAWAARRLRVSARRS